MIAMRTFFVASLLWWYQLLHTEFTMKGSIIQVWKKHALLGVQHSVTLSHRKLYLDLSVIGLHAAIIKALVIVPATCKSFERMMSAMCAVTQAQAAVRHPLTILTYCTTLHICQYTAQHANCFPGLHTFVAVWNMLVPCKAAVKRLHDQNCQLCVADDVMQSQLCNIHTASEDFKDSYRQCADRNRAQKAYLEGSYLVTLLRACRQSSSSLSSTTKSSS